MPADFSGKTQKHATVILGVGASVSAYKAVEVLRLLKKTQCDVWVCPTRNSLHFVGAATWESLSGNPVRIDTFSSVEDIAHVSLAHKADAMVVVAASADLLARFRLGMADDYLTLEAVTVSCPLLIAPAMHPTMWNNLAVQDNVSVLKQRGWRFIGPQSGTLADGSSGIGRLSEPEFIAEAVCQILGFPAPK